MADPVLTAAAPSDGPVAESDTWRLTASRVVLGMIAGAAVGASLTMVAIQVALARLSPDRDPMPTNPPLAWLILFCVWLVIIAAPGAGAWFVMHRRGHRSPVNALTVGAGGSAVAGVVTAAITALYVGHYYSTGYFVLVSALSVAFAAIVSGVVALTIWRVAYRRGPAAT